MNSKLKNIFCVLLSANFLFTNVGAMNNKGGIEINSKVKKPQYNISKKKSNERKNKQIWFLIFLLLKHTNDITLARITSKEPKTIFYNVITSKSVISPNNTEGTILNLTEKNYKSETRPQIKQCHFNDKLIKLLVDRGVKFTCDKRFQGKLSELDDEKGSRFISILSATDDDTTYNRETIETIADEFSNYVIKMTENLKHGRIQLKKVELTYQDYLNYSPLSAFKPVNGDYEILYNEKI